jgi:hypothetical protein
MRIGKTSAASSVSDGKQCKKKKKKRAANSAEKKKEGLQGVFKWLRRNGHQLKKGLQMAQRGPSLK